MNIRRLVRISVAIIAVMTVIGAVAWVQLPTDAQVPVHWGPNGQIDGWADKTTGLFLLPIIATGLTAVFVAIPRIEPRRTNLERSAKSFGAIWIATLLLLAALQGLVAAVALGADIDVTKLILAGTGVVFLVIGNYLPKVRPNYLVGIRTPWTLTSDLSWTRTHRLGGRLFVLAGLGLIALGILGAGPEVLLVALVGGLIALLIVIFVYSYRVWQTDPTRRTS
jgi:uncharacterized membrane protein